jgi:hypothetical protein
MNKVKIRKYDVIIGLKMTYLTYLLYRCNIKMYIY